MRKQHLIVLFLTALASIPACGSDEGPDKDGLGSGKFGEPNPPDDATSGSSSGAAAACAEGVSKCTEQNAGEVCADGEWHEVDCDDFCESDGYDLSLSCSQIDSTSASCDCRQTCSDPGATACANNPSYVAGCEHVGGEAVWSFFDCDEICVQGGYDGSYGCEYIEEADAELCSCY